MALVALYLCLLLVCESALAAALPTTGSALARRQPSPSLWWEPSIDGTMTCDPPSYAEDLDLEPANWRQCASLYSSLAGQNGTFHISNSPNATAIPLLSHTDCILSVLPLDTDKGPYTIGSRDVETILGDGLRNFSRGTLLSVKGVVKCDVAGGGRAGLSWQISKSAG
ncbi:hypothetical protein CDD81_3703 [Ophiocordyceps australis]|uniref:Ecp2 effector protein-like domain-containing protein n=1 Tax=Ophiocordyceps australis TaxID=1399860 RepID=A0A2C5XRQ1_9HYPO|nr:hypothetical protein CDD81_3703 [Ophiocordyceps australis]